MWHMHADVPVEDPTYRSFWRQLLRWVTNDAPSRIAVATEESVVPPGGTVVLRADVTDSAYTPLGDAVVNATMISPSGAEREIRMEWSVERDGEYQARLAVEETGVHTLRVTATTRSGDVLIDSAFIATNTNGTEMFDAGMRSSLLRRMAQETGGRFYEPSDVSSLAEDLALSKRGVTVVKEMDLWDMPLVFIIVVTLVSTEWFYRKRRGLA
jgi:hypothetical protein